MATKQERRDLLNAQYDALDLITDQAETTADDLARLQDEIESNLDVVPRSARSDLKSLMSRCQDYENTVRASYDRLIDLMSEVDAKRDALNE